MRTRRIFISWTLALGFLFILLMGVTRAAPGVADGAKPARPPSIEISGVAAGDDGSAISHLLADSNSTSIRADIHASLAVSALAVTATKTAPTEAQPGQVITYQIVIHNTGDTSGTVDMKDNVPEGVAYAGHQPPLSYTVGPPKSVFWKGELGVSNTITLTWRVTVTGDVSYTIYNRAVISACERFTVTAGTHITWHTLPPPGFNPSKWNSDTTTMLNNNCYNYACNKQTDTFARPGRYGHYSPSLSLANLTCAVVISAAKADGLTEIDCDHDCPAGSHKCALAVSPRRDFHWYRQDADGKWSHKPGAAPATNRSQVKDASSGDTNDTIDSLDEVKRDAASRQYTNFCTCFCCSNDPGQVTIRKFGPLPCVAQTETITVSMSIFSGRRDPEWKISDPGDITALKGFLDGLPAASPPDWPTLWWRGIMLENNGVANFPVLVRVFSETIQIFDVDGQSEYYQDVNGLETWLLDRLPDFDGDGLPSLDEALLGTDPTNPDTDGDGFSDDYEVDIGTDPLDPADIPWHIYLPLILRDFP